MAENQIELDLASDVDTEVEVETPEPEESGVEIASADQFEKADNATQKRIDRLTKKMREAERRENEAVNYAKQVQQEAETLKSRMANLDNNYVKEYTNRVSTQMSQVEQEYARAMEMGDTQAAVEANRKLTELSIELRGRHKPRPVLNSRSRSNSRNSRCDGLIKRLKIGPLKTIGLVRMMP